MKTKTKSRRVLPFSFQSTLESKQDYPSLRFGWTLGEGFTKKSSDRCAIFLFSFPFVYESKLSTLLETKKASRIRLAFLSSGDRTRTCGLRVMSPTSYQLLHPAIYLETCCFPYWDYKDTNFFGFCKSPTIKNV